MTKGLSLVSVKLPLHDLRRIPSQNRSRFIREAVAEKLERVKKPKWTPKTAYGKELWALRQKFIADGGKLLDREGIERELKERSGLR